jgi:hypothetical protein
LPVEIKTLQSPSKAVRARAFGGRITQAKLETRIRIQIRRSFLLGM